MEKNNDRVEITAEMPDGSDYLVLSAFEYAYDPNKQSSDVKIFSEAVKELITQKLAECQTDEDVAEFNNHLKAEVLSFMDSYLCEPWEPSVQEEPGMAEFIAPIMDHINDPQEFAQTEQFQDAVVLYASGIAPYSQEKAQAAILLTPADLSQKFVQKAYAVKSDMESGHWRGQYEESHQESIAHGVLVISTISEMFPANEELGQASKELVNNYIENAVESYVSNHIYEMIPEWDETAIVGFSIHDMIFRKIESKTEEAVEFADYREAQDFLHDQVSEFVTNYLAKNGKRLVAECIDKNQSLKDFAERTDQDLESAFLTAIADNLPDCFDDHNSDANLGLLHRLYDLVNEEFVRKSEEAREKEEAILAEIAADYRDI